MSRLELRDYQLDAVGRMKNGCILCGGVGSGKSLTALAYFYMQNGGEWSFLHGGEYVPMDDLSIKHLYIITTARKRDTMEWEGELTPFLLYPTANHETILYSQHVVVVDSWNNIGKYVAVKDAFFIFDEQRVIGSGSWVKSFLKITKSNDWIMLSATPGDTWSDYIPVFVANGFYKNRTEFTSEHIVYSHYSNFPKIDHYTGTGRLLRLRKDILVTMDFDRETRAHHEDIYTKYNILMYKEAGKERFDPFKNEPIQNAGGLCSVWRKIVNTDESRRQAVLDVMEKHPKVIIFYNFDYELDILKSLCNGIKYPGFGFSEWNGHRHEEIPKTPKWAYLVQYTAGCEGWNCVETDTIIFYSQNYSYKVMTQAAGRTDRLNTPFRDLYYYHLKSRSGIDLAISKALGEKKNFNESKYARF